MVLTSQVLGASEMLSERTCRGAVGTFRLRLLLA